ncbi:MAG: MarC family protein [Neisseriaceae bacterium]|nr:MAG: MarC family protein [Neisseriaceae bacterium]
MVTTMSNYLQIFITLLSLLNPMFALGQYLDMTKHMTQEDKQNISIMCGLTVFALLGSFLFLGQYILTALSIHAYSLRLGGGVILLLLGINLTLSSKSEGDKGGNVSQNYDQNRIKSLGVSPLGLPMVVGPASMVLVIVYGEDAPGIVGKLPILVILAVIATIITITFILSSYIARAIGDVGVVIITKIMGLVVTAIAFEMIIAGMQTVVPILMAK